MSGARRWLKSSYSSDAGGQCAEVAYDWIKSSYSSPNGGDCVEVAGCPHAVRVRDSKNLGPTLTLDPTAWAGFTNWAAGQA
ncbi:DUF397 domain-containing protein [Streptomyces racemochromogenes]|uniref:DUF397 domain-containing protein n=1 Tax=Streptomyces racemochromogenes TaxID=67353 RepID=A0ABW7PK76_9ACTN